MADIASNSDKPTSQHSLDETAYILFCCHASRRIRFGLNGDPHERIHRYDLLRQRLHNAEFWERLWRAAGIQSALCFIVAYLVYDHRPQVGASADARADFYDGDRMRILIAAVFYGLAVLNPMWFEGALGTPLRMRDKTVGAGRLGNHMLTSGTRTTSWAGFGLTFFSARDAYHARAVKHGFHKEC